MTKFYRMVIQQFLPVFIFALMFFVLLLEMTDLFANLPQYMAQEAEISKVLLTSFYYLPKCISFSIPIALLFAVSFTLGTFYSNNELIAVFNSGIPLIKFILPLLIFGLLLSIGNFLFEENIVIDYLSKKNDLTEDLQNTQKSFSNTNITLPTEGGRVVYHADYFNDKNTTLSRVSVIRRDENGAIIERVDSDRAVWENGVWNMERATLYSWDNGIFISNREPSVQLDWVNEKPASFRRPVRDLEEMHLDQAKEYLEDLRRTGSDVYREALTDYYNRYAFSLTPLIVAFISSSIGGRFKKNILLMSLLVSLGITIVYYVFNMVTVLFAKEGYISPVTGAWTPLYVFTIIGFLLFRYAKT